MNLIIFFLVAIPKKAKIGGKLFQSTPKYTASSCWYVFIQIEGALFFGRLI